MMFGYFGERNPREMPRHLFSGCRKLDYDSAVRADISKQNFSICPRHWYIDATIRCARCGNDSCFTAAEQRAWYEVYGFYIDSFPRHCRDCRDQLRRVKALRQEYDRDIEAALGSDDCTMKERLADVIDLLCEGPRDLPAKMHENRRLLASQIAGHRGRST